MTPFTISVPPAETPDVDNQQSEVSDEGRGGRGSGRGNSRRNPRRSQAQLSNPSTFAGEHKDIDYILGLPLENFVKKVTFEIFTERVYNHCLSNFTDGASLQPLLVRLVDPFIDFTKKIKPKDLPSNTTDVDITIYDKKCDMYVKLEETLYDNLQKVYGLIWGQCSAGLRADIKGLNEYQEATDSLDALWLMLNLKKSDFWY